MLAMTEVVMKDKMNKQDIDNYYRYGVYFYTAGMVLLKNNKNSAAKEFLKRAQALWKDILNPTDPGLESLRQMLKLCDKKPVNIVK
jgi:hypothetical protein